MPNQTITNWLKPVASGNLPVTLNDGDINPELLTITCDNGVISTGKKGRPTGSKNSTTHSAGGHRAGSGRKKKADDSPKCKFVLSYKNICSNR